jgi:flagellar hook-length control protein FliK
LQTSGVAETWEASVAAPLEFGVRSEALLPTPYSPSSSHFLTFPLSHFQFGVRSSEFGVAFGVTFGNQSDVGSVSRTTVHKVIEESQSSGVERRFSETEELNHRQSVHIEKVVQPQSSPETPTELQEAKGQMAESHTVPATPPDAEKAEGSEVDLARVEELRTAGEGGASSQLKRPINQAPAGIRQRSPVEAGLRQRGNEGASNQSQAHKPAASQLRRTLTEPLQQFQAGSSYQTLDDGVTQPIPSVAQAAYAAPPDRTLPGATPDPLWSPLIRGTTELLLNETNTGTDTANAAANAEAEVNRVDIFDALLTPRSAEILSHAVEIDSDNSGAIDSHERELRAHIFNEIRGLHQRRETYKELKIQLTPPHLGRLTVKIGQKEGGVAVRVQASTPEAQQWLLSELSQLEGDLREQGIRLASLDVSVGGDNSYYQPHHQRQASFSFNRQRPARWVTGNRAGSIQITELPRFFYADGHLNLAV